MQEKLKTVAVVTATMAAAVSGALISAGTAQAVTPSTTTINFTGDTPGGKPAGFVSVTNPNVSFRSTSGSISISDFGVQSNGQAIAAFGATAGLDIRLAKPTTAISMAFGNDDPGFVDTTAKAQLELFRGVTKVGTAAVNVNANDVMDQRVGYGNARVFDRVVVTFVSSTGAPNALTEVIDDINLAPLCTKAGGPGNNIIIGTANKDVLCGDSGNDIIRGGGGRDLIYGGPGQDTVLAGDDADWVNAGAGADTVRGGDGADILLGVDSRDRLFGDAGPDILVGGTSRDACNGGQGRDTAQSCEVRVSIP